MSAADRERIEAIRERWENFTVWPDIAWLLSQLSDALSEGEAMRERCAQVAESMALNPWGAPHDGITPGHLAEQIAAAIRHV